MTSREHAEAFVKAYSKPAADDYERHLLDFAKRWLNLIDDELPEQEAVHDMLSELDVDHPAYGSGWVDLQMGFRSWAKAQIVK